MKKANFLSAMIIVLIGSALLMACQESVPILPGSGEGVGATGTLTVTLVFADASNGDDFEVAVWDETGLETLIGELTVAIAGGTASGVVDEAGNPGTDVIFPVGKHYLRAFIDENGNGFVDTGELYIKGHIWTDGTSQSLTIQYSKFNVWTL